MDRVWLLVFLAIFMGKVVDIVGLFRFLASILEKVVDGFWHFLLVLLEKLWI